MTFFPHEYNGFLFQQKNRVASEFDDFDWDISGISTNVTARDNNRPEYSGAILGGVVKVVRVTLNNPKLDRDPLVIAMDASGPTQHRLYALDELGKKWWVNAKCTGLNTEKTDGSTVTFGYIFDVDDPVYTAVDPSDDVWTGPEDGDTHIITIGGNQPTNPIFTFGFGAPDYYPYTQYVKNYNPIASLQVDGIDITNGGLDTDALVTAGKMLANGDDVRVIFDGIEIPRWFGGGGMDSATTKIFIRAAWKPGQFMPLRTAIAASGDFARLEWAVTNDVKKALKRLPISGIVRIGTEEFSYENMNAVLCQADLVARTIRRSTLGGHSIGDITWWVEHDIRIIYGNASAGAPSYNDVYKPVYDLTTSTNTSRVYTVFADTNNLRVGSFKRQVLNDGIGKLNRVYSGSHGSFIEVDPATEMGMEIAAYQAQGRTRPETAELAWQYYHPAIVLTVTTVGEKYKLAATTTWPANAELQSSLSGKEASWVREWNEAVPALANTYTALTNTAAETLVVGSKYFRYHLFGSVNAILNNVARMEITGATVTLTSANVIQTGLSSEQDNYQFYAELRNLTTGETLFIDYPTREDDIFIIDSDGMKVTYNGMNAIRGISWDTIRTNWLKFVPGPNEIQYVANPEGYVIITTRIYEKAM